MHDGDWDNGWSSGSWWWLSTMVMMIAFGGGLVWVAVTLLHRNPHATQPSTAATVVPAAERRPSPEEILAERLARGEIDPDDYRQRLTALRPDAAAVT